MDKKGLLNEDGSRNRLALVLGGAIVASAWIGWNLYFLVQLLAGLALFTLVFVPILAAAFVLVMAEQAGEWGVARIEGVAPRLRQYLQMPQAVPRHSQPVNPAPFQTFGPDLPREFQRAVKNGFHLSHRRHAA